MQITAAELPSRLVPLSPLYLVHGDEPLLAIEAGDLIRGAARAAGCDEREVLVVEPGFKWDALLAATRNLGLFGGRKLIDLRIPSGKPGIEGARALDAWAASPSGDAVALITMPRLDRAAQGSAWFGAWSAPASSSVQPLDRRSCRRGSRRLARSRQRASRETLQFLADTTEGNLLATQQEIDNWRCSCPRASSILPRSSRRSPTWRASTSSSSAKHGWGRCARACRILGALESAGRRR
jgi:DNA polymerase-3 subunit delta